MDMRGERLIFGKELGESFCLEIRFHLDAPDQAHRVLTRNGKKVKIERRTLDLLVLFLHNSQKELPERIIEKRIWGNGNASGNVEQSVYKLRKILGDNAHDSRFIETIPKTGYKFVLDVASQPLHEEPSTTAANFVRISERWEHEAFVRFLNRTVPGDSSDEAGDLRILTVAFSSGVPDVITDLMEKDLRIRILLVNESMISARNKVRPNYTPAKSVTILREQREVLMVMKKRGKKGTLEVRETDVMPYGFVAHNRSGALIGLFLATESYVRGPMIEVGRSTKLWQTLLDDWKELWRNAVSRSGGRNRTVR